MRATASTRTYARSMKSCRPSAARSRSERYRSPKAASDDDGHLLAVQRDRVGKPGGIGHFQNQGGTCPRSVTDAERVRPSIVPEDQPMDVWTLDEIFEPSLVHEILLVASDTQFDPYSCG